MQHNEMKAPPFDLDAEKTILGIVVIDNSKMFDILSIVDVDDLYDRSHQVIFECMKNLLSKNVPVDFITLRDELHKTGKLEDVGGIPYLVKIADDITSTANVSYHCNIIKEKSNLRKLIRIGNKLSQSGFEGKELSSNLIAEASNGLSAINLTEKSEIKRVDHEIDKVPELLNKLYDNPIENRMHSGLSSLDGICRWFKNGQIIIIGAMPAMGKTSLALTIAENITIRQNRPVVFFSLEMDMEFIQNWVISAEAEVDGYIFQFGTKSVQDKVNVKKAIKRIENKNLMIDDNGYDIDSLCAAIKRYDKIYQPELFVIDYFQLIMPTVTHGNRTEKMTDVAIKIKNTAKAVRKPIIVCSQVTREVGSRTVQKSKDAGAKEPQLSDLRDTGALESSTDIVLMPFSMQVYREQEDSFDGDKIITKSIDMPIYIRKNKGGKVSKVTLEFQRAYTKFVERKASFE